MQIKGAVRYHLTPVRIAIIKKSTNTNAGEGIKKREPSSTVVVKWKPLTRVQLFCNPMDNTVHGILQARILECVAFPFSRGSSQPRSPALRVDSLQLSHKGSPRILEWVAYPFSSWSSQPRNRTGVFCTAGRFFTNWAIREALGCLRFPYSCITSII